MRVRLESIGCRLNIGEIEALARQLAGRGFRIVGPGDDADLCVFNSCTVTATASRKSRQFLRQLRRSAPDATLVATGCYSELSPSEVKALGVDLVIPNRDKDRIVELLDEARLLRTDDASPDRVPPPHPDDPDSRTRAFVKVQDGCDNHCTFCVVTIARGPGRSRPPVDVVEEIEALIGLGHREVILSGVHLGSYGRDLGQASGLEHLIRRILRETDIPRLRLSSLEPWDLEPSFFELFSDRRLMPHLHLPLQSGCEATLERMARRTSQREYGRLVAAARDAVPKISISTDVMVGFPGETDDEFTQSISFVREMEFSRLHVFRFSSREGTRAAAMADQVPGDVAQERSRRVIELGAHLEQTFNRRFVGQEMGVLWERGEILGPHRRWTGLTDNYIRCATDTPTDVDLTNRVTDTRLIATIPGGFLGDVHGASIPRLIQPDSATGSRFTILNS